MSLSQGKGPSILLDEQIELVRDRAQEVLREHIGQVDPSEEEDYYASAQDRISAMQNQSQFSLLDNYSSSGLYDATRDFFKDIAREQEYYHKLEYRSDRYHDSVLNLFRWFKLHSGGRLDDPPSIQYEFIIENFDEFRIELSHKGRTDTIDADPVLQSMLILLWRVAEDVFDIWDRLLSQGDWEAIDSDVNLTHDEGDIGFISSMNSNSGTITTYQFGEEGPKAEFEVSNDIDFFPSEGDLVRIEYADDPTHRDYQYGRDNVPVSRVRQF